MNRLTAVAAAAVLLAAFCGLWAWGLSDAQAGGEWADRAGPGRLEPGREAGSAGSQAMAPGTEPAAASLDRDRLQDRLEEPGAAPGPTLVVKVLDQFGRAVAGAAVWRWQASEAGSMQSVEASEVETDGEGRASLPSSPSPGGIVVLARNHPVTLRRLPALTGEHEVGLEAGARVQGWVRVDGKPPGEPVRLRLYSAETADPLAELPLSLRRILWSRVSKRRIVRTTAHGEFEFPGLPPGWHGEIALPTYLWFQDQSLKGEQGRRFYKLDNPQTGLQLETTLLPGVRGRVVWDDTGEGVKTRVRATAEFDDGDSSGPCSFSTDGQGCFRLGFGPGSRTELRAWANGGQRKAIRRITVSVSAAGARQLRRVIPEPESLESGIELRLLRATVLHFRAADTRGRPLPGAVLQGLHPSEPSDAEGRGTVEVEDLGQRRFLAAAPGHAVAWVEAEVGAGTLESPLELVLAKANKLVVVLRDASGQVPPGVYLSVRSRQPLATGSEAGRFTGLHRVVGTASCGENWGRGGRMDYWFEPGDNGEIVLASLRPKVPFQLAVVDSLTQDILVRDAVTPEEGRVERIELRLEGKPRDVTGLVVDHHERPMAGVRVAAMFGNRGKLAKTDARGSFRFEGGYATGNEFTLEVSHRGYVSVEREDLELTEELEPIKVRLLPGHDVKVRFVDPGGSRLPVRRCWINGKLDYGRIKHIEPGLLLLQDLPPEPVMLSTRVGGRKFELRHQPAASDTARFVLPAMGRFQVEAPRPSELKWHELRVKVTARSDGKSFELAFRSGSDSPAITTRERILLPGNYTVEVHARKSAGGHLLYPARQMTIEAGKLTVCRFGR